jgi:thrombospondin motif-containing protein 9
MSLFDGASARTVIPVLSSGGVDAQYAYSVRSDDPEGTPRVVVNLVDVAGNSASEVVDLSAVVVDPRPPVMTSFSVVSGPSRASTGDVIVFAVNASEPVLATSTLFVRAGLTTVSLPSTYPSGTVGVQSRVLFEFVVPASLPAGTLDLSVRLVDRANNVNTVPVTGVTLPVVLTTVTLRNLNGTMPLAHHSLPILVEVTLSRTAAVGGVSTRCSSLVVSPAVVGAATVYSGAVTSHPPESNRVSFGCVVQWGAISSVNVTVPTDALSDAGVWSAAATATFDFAIPVVGSLTPELVVSTAAAVVGPVVILPYPGTATLQLLWSVDAVPSCGTRLSMLTPTALSTVVRNFTLGCVHRVQVVVTDTRAPLSVTVTYTVSWPGVLVPASLVPPQKWCVVGEVCPVSFTAGGFGSPSRVVIGARNVATGQLHTTSTAAGSSSVLASFDTLSMAFAEVVLPTDMPVGTYRLVTIVETLSGSAWRSAESDSIDVRSLPYVIEPSSHWGDCSAECGMGEQWRELVCVQSDGSESANLNACPNAALPSLLEGDSSLHRRCMNGACASVGVAWFVGSFGDCSASCGGGTQSRVVECRNRENAPLPDSSCVTVLGGDKPLTTLACNSHACEAFSIVSSTSTGCSRAPCLGGQQSQLLTCVGDRGAWGVLGSQCAGSVLLSTVPLSARAQSSALVTQACSISSCPAFVTQRGTWSSCQQVSSSGSVTSVTCGSGSRTRADVCLSAASNFSEVPFASCGSQSVVVESCTLPSCSLPQWEVGPFGRCSGGGDGTCDGNHTRVVRCVDARSHALLSEASCLRATGVAPATMAPCPACEGSACSDDCSGHGRCSVTNECECDAGYSGPSCATASSCGGIRYELLACVCACVHAGSSSCSSIAAFVVVASSVVTL